MHVVSCESWQIFQSSSFIEEILETASKQNNNLINLKDTLNTLAIHLSFQVRGSQTFRKCLSISDNRHFLSTMKNMSKNFQKWCTHYTKEMSISSLIAFFPLTFNLIHTLLHSSCSMVRSDILNSHCRCSIKKGVLKYFSKFTGKHLKNTFFHRILPVAASVYYMAYSKCVFPNQYQMNQ